MHIFKTFLLTATILSSAIAHADDSPQWLTYPGDDGPGKEKRVVMAKILSTHHGFDCTVLFAMNEKGEVDSTMPVYPEKGQMLREHR